MGAYSPLPWLNERFGSETAFVDEVIDTIALPTVRRLAEEDTPFIGLLYCGLIVTDAGIRVIEFNARFGDPETQVVLPRLVTPLSALLLAASLGQLAGVARPEFSDDVAVAVVLASENYPDAPVSGREISGLGAASLVPGVTIAHAATAAAAGGSGGAGGDAGPGTLIATGGRVLSVVAVGQDFAEARSRAYRALDEISLEGGQFRTDVAARVAG
jgi:phosphoribosylamine--glycine ligase